MRVDAHLHVAACLTGVEFHGDRLSGGVLVAHGEFHHVVRISRVDFERDDGGDAQPVLRTHAVQGVARCRDGGVVLRCGGDAQLQLTLGAWEEGETHAHVLRGPRSNPRADLPANLSDHALRHHEADVETVRLVAVVADLEFHRLSRVSGDVGLIGILVEDRHGCRVKDLHRDLEGLPHGVVVHVSSNDRRGVETGFEAQWHVELEGHTGLAVPGVQQRGLFGEQLGLEPPVGLLQFERVLFFRVSGVDQRQRNHTGLAVGSAADLILFRGEGQRTEHGDLDVAHQHIGAKQRTAAGRAGGAEVEGNRAWRRQLVGRHVEVQVHRFTLVQVDRKRHNRASIVHHKSGPVRFGKDRTQAVIRIPIAGVLQAERDEPGLAGQQGIREQRRVAVELDAVLFRHAHWNGEHALHFAVGVIVEGHVPILLLHVGTRWDGQVEPHAGGHASVEILEDDVVVVVVRVEVRVDADLQVWAHPRGVADLGKHADRGRLVPVVGDVTLQDQQAVWWRGKAALRVVAIHVQGELVNLADAELDEVVDVHAFAGTAAVRVEQEAVVPRVAAEEDVRVAEGWNLCPIHLRVPREVGPIAGAAGRCALAQVPVERLHGVVVLTGRAPHLDGDGVTVVGRTPRADMELR